MNNKLIIMQFMPEFGIAGAEKMVQDLAVCLQADSHNVILVSLYNFKSVITEYIESKNIPIFYLNKRSGVDLRVVRRIRSIILQYKPDIIHTHRYLLPYVSIASLFMNVKRVHTIHNIAKHESSFKNRVINWFLFKTKFVTPVAISTKIQDSISSTYNLRKKNIPVIFNGINLLRCIPKSTYDFSEKIEIIHIGRFADAKNHSNLVDAIWLIHTKYRNIHLSCYGKGELFDEINMKIKRLGMEEFVTLHGVKTDVYSYLSRSDIFVLPSLWEGAPITIIEAMASGLPIVTTDVGGIGEYIIDNITGIIVNIDPQSIAKGIEKLIIDQSLRTRLGHNALMNSKRFSSQVMADGYVRLYNGEINDKG